LSLGHALQPTVQHTTYVRAKIPYRRSRTAVRAHPWLADTASARDDARSSGGACLHVRSSVA
jgi:hypothetical protein